MVKALSAKTLLARKIAGLAVKDYFGERIPEDMFERIRKAIVSKRIMSLDVWERIHADHILANLADSEYCRSLAEGL